MESSQYYYLKLNKYLLCCVGQWPYQTPLEKILVGSVFLPIAGFQVMFQTWGMIASLIFDDFNAFVEDFSPGLISYMCFMKYFNFFNRQSIKTLLDTMQEDWKLYTKSKEEYDIMCKHYALGKRVTFLYTVSIFGTMGPYMFVQPIVNVFKKFGLVNGTIVRELMFRYDYFMNVEKYYYPLLLHTMTGTVTFILMVVACDSMIVLFIRHECGLCEILGSRLRNIVESDNMDIELNPDKHDDKAYQTVKSCAILHKHILHFGNTIEEMNTMSSFLQIGFNMIGMSFTQFQAIANLDDPNMAVRFIPFSMCLYCILLLSSLPGQQLSDCTGSIFVNTLENKWYQSSIQARKILHIILLKSMQPMRLTAGKLYILDLQNFTAVLKASFSYCMVLCSFK
ncbi:odorant receptor 13a [Nomia melanderi]|uniref:odorant receptor 13a n=1 Tax=Nomia melanderi TaxID=2448451 RepID=UPI003FCE9085